MLTAATDEIEARTLNVYFKSETIYIIDGVDAKLTFTLVHHLVSGFWLLV